MRIKEFFIDGFGIFHDLRVRDLSPGLNLFSGDNEAGKSTLLAFFRAVFFGFETGQSRQNPYKPASGGEHGGVITVEMGKDGSDYRVQRAPGRAQGRLIIHTGEASEEGEDTLLRLLPGVTKGLYRNVFAFSLDELQDVTSLTAEEVRSRIYSYGAGAGQISAVDVEQRLGKEMDGLFAPRARDRVVNKTLTDIAQTQSTIRDLSARTAEYDEFRGRLNVLNDEIRSSEERLDELRLRVKHLEQLDKVWEDWASLATVRKELEGLPKIESFPEDGVGRLDQCKEKQQELTGKLERARSELEGERARLAELMIDPSLVGARDQIEGLMQERVHFQNALSDLPDQESAARSACDVLADTLRQIGEGWTEDRVLNFDTSLAVRGEARQLGERLSRSREAVQQGALLREQAERDLRDKQGECRIAEEALQELPANDAAAETIARREEVLRNARTWHSELQRLQWIRRTVEDRRAQAERQRASREADASRAPRAALKWIGIPVAFVMLVFAALHAREAATSVPLAVLGIAVAVAAVLVDRRQAAVDAARIARLREDIAELDRVISDADRDLASGAEETQKVSALLQNVAGTLGREVKTVEDLNAVEAAITADKDAESRRRALADRLEEKRRDASRAEDRVSETIEKQTRAREEGEDAARGWTVWLKQKGLPATLTADTALELLGRIETAREKSQAAATVAGRAGQIRTYLDGFEPRAAAVFTRCGRPVPDRASLAAALSSLDTALKESLASAEKRPEIEAGIAKIEREIRACEADLERAAEEWSGLLQGGGAPDEETFRLRARQYQRRCDLLHCQGQHEQNIELVGGSGIDQELAETDEVSIQSDLAIAGAELTQMETETAGKRDERGRVNERIESIEKSEELSVALMQQRSLFAMLEDVSARWAVLAISRELLRQAREHYEREKQPRVVQTASRFLQKITGGAYSGVFSPLGQEEVQLETPEGLRKDTLILSRGTREPLYLSLRFGLIQEYCRNAEPLPVIMDDILVNFDPARAAAAAEAILELAQSNQVLFFTCHPETVDRFLSLDRSMNCFGIRDGIVEKW